MARKKIVNPLGATTGLIVKKPSTPAASSNMFSPQSLGYNSRLSDAFTNAGINQLPEYMRQFSSPTNWDFGSGHKDENLVDAYLKSIVMPGSAGMSGHTGKAEPILNQMGWQVKNGKLTYVGGLLGDENIRPMGVNDYDTVGAYTQADKNRTWTQADQDLFGEKWMQRKFGINEGTADTLRSRNFLGGMGTIIAAGVGAGGLGAAYGGAAAALPAAEGAIAGGMGVGELGLSTLAPVAAEGVAAGGAGAAGIGELGLSTLAPAGEAGLGGIAGTGIPFTGVADLGLPASQLGTTVPTGTTTAWGAGLETGLHGFQGLGTAYSGANTLTGQETAGGGMDWLGSLGSIFGNATGNGGNSGWLGTALGLGAQAWGAYQGNEAQQDAVSNANRQQRRNRDFQQGMYDQTAAMFAPYQAAGVGALGAMTGVDPTGGSGKFLTELGNLSKNFKFDETDPAYQAKVEQSTKNIDKQLAARGLYNSRAGLNLQDESGRAIMADEYDKQYGRSYTALMDQFNMANTLGQTSYSKLLDLIKIGTGAAGSAGSAAMGLGQGVASSFNQTGQNALYSGQSQADFYSGLGALPTNWMTLQALLNNNTRKTPTAGNNTINDAYLDYGTLGGRK